jgi:hypothetical protein
MGNGQWLMRFDYVLIGQVDYVQLLRITAGTQRRGVNGLRFKMRMVESLTFVSIVVLCALCVTEL